MPFKRRPEFHIVSDKSVDNETARTLSKGFELLRSFRPGEQYLGNKELAERTGLSKPTVSRLTGVLVQLGYLRYCPSSAATRWESGCSRSPIRC